MGVAHLLGALVWALLSRLCSASNAALIDNLNTAIDVAKSTLHHIMRQWEVKNYPNFLQSGGLSPEAWTLMKLKLQAKVLAAAVSGQRQKWVVAFMGSSVTAGRDSPVNASVVAHTEKMMKPALLPLGVVFRGNSNAHEANPCIPYDLCVHAYAGQEADMVQWEQDYNCGGNSIYAEYFIRSALHLPNRPIVVFSHSATENWEPKDCDAPVPPYRLTEHDHALMKAFKESPRSLFTEINKKYDPHNQKWHGGEHYKAAGVQTFWHQDHQVYKCLGPFTRDFGCCCAPWHPSLKGHLLRASHHVLVWMSVLKEALLELKHSLESSPSESLAMLQTRVAEQLDAFYSKHPLLPPRLYANDLSMPDVVQCWTNYEPRSDRSTSLSKALIDQRIAETFDRWEKDIDDWHVVVADRLHYGDSLFESRRKYGYRDYKVVLEGHKGSGPVSLHFTSKSKGKIMICDLAQIWETLQFKGKLAPERYCRLLECTPKVYVTLSQREKPQSFEFSPSTAMEISFVKYHDSSDCILSTSELSGDFSFVMTILPQTERRHLISHIIIP